MNPIRRTIGRLACILAGLAAALATCTAASAAPATRVPPPGTGDSGTQPITPVVHTVTVGGMPGWQIALIAVGAALLAALLAVIADRARAARRRQMAGAV